MSENQQENDSDQLYVELENVSTHIPVTSSEVDNQNQQPIDEEICETMVEEHPIDQDLLLDYQLARDRERRQHEDPQRFQYESEFAFAYASYQELVDNEPRGSHEE
ncbi:Uncharacterized protein Adt_15027 [Abeliophyllum distichum]|uniref:Uncharacterized protein n=1 Tax=Abeliophyllum distichum TaxID=126358 RepID=A0ABD1U2E1_9LAMI